MHIKPLLSICIPAYNRPNLLEDSLIKILTQLDDNNLHDMVQIVIVDDSTTSPSDTMILRYLKQYSNIVYKKNEKNLGWINTVTITKYATGDYTLLIADDDALTPFAIPYVIELIQKTNFDFLVHQPIFSENTSLDVAKNANLYHTSNGLHEFTDFLVSQKKNYQQLISIFSFYSSIVSKTSYLLDALEHVDKEVISRNYFPHEFISYYNLKDKKILFPLNTFVIGRLLNESYPGSTMLIRHLYEVIDSIERQNNLGGQPSWEYIKKICKNGRKRTIYLGILLKKLHIDYKNNAFLKKLYFIYKKYLQK